MDATRYQQEAQVTLSHSFFGEYVELSELIDALNNAIVACAEVDRIKKVLFYGRGINERAHVVRKPFVTLGSVPLTGKQEEILHALIGIGTEGAECLEIVRDWVHGMLMRKYDSDMYLYERSGEHLACPQPKVSKTMEEAGGTLWYIAILAEASGISLGEIMALNIAQLRARYKDKFDAFEANNRNLKFETSVMNTLASQGKQAAATMDASVAYASLPTADEESTRYTAQVRDGLSHDGVLNGQARSVPLRSNNN